MNSIIETNFRQTKHGLEKKLIYSGIGSIYIGMGIDINIYNFYIKPEKRGKGYGSKLLDQAILVALRENKNIFLSCTNVGYSWKSKFYERHGFKNLGGKDNLFMYDR